jgi:hypothetical protein
MCAVSPCPVEADDVSLSADPGRAN